MGSDSDLPVMQAAIDVLAEFGVPHEVRIVSAHRTPDVMFEYARRPPTAASGDHRGRRRRRRTCPGMTASMTPLPVIGVPVPLAQLDGLDSLLSIVQMPGGHPGRDGRDRQREERRPARGAHPRRRATRSCAPRWSSYQADLARAGPREGRHTATASDVTGVTR